MIHLENPSTCQTLVPAIHRQISVASHVAPQPSLTADKKPMISFKLSLMSWYWKAATTLHHHYTVSPNYSAVVFNQQQHHLPKCFLRT
eukprot:c55224_g1_i1 orf=81-344(-)